MDYTGKGKSDTSVSAKSQPPPFAAPMPSIPSPPFKSNTVPSPLTLRSLRLACSRRPGSSALRLSLTVPWDEAC